MEWVLSIDLGLTAAEICELTFEYQGLDHGRKGRWLVEHGISKRRMGRWRASLFDGDLDRGLVPRQGGAVTRSSDDETRSSDDEQTAIARRRAAERAAHGADVERLNARIRELEDANGALEKANGALGKAIGLLHERSEREPDAIPTMTDPEDSSTPRTGSSPS